MSKFTQRLNAKISQKETLPDDNYSVANSIALTGKSNVEKIDISKITLSPYQPRVINNDVLADLQLLADNINEHGLINPIIVRKDHGKFELIAGERRLRAVRDILHQKEIFAYVKHDVTDLNAAILALIDNTARENLTDYEFIKSIQSICMEFNISLSNESYLLERFSLKRSEWSRLKSMMNLPQFIIADLEHNPKLMSANSAKLLCAVITKAMQKVSIEEIEKNLMVAWKKFIENDYDSDAKYQTRPYIHILEQQFNLSDQGNVVTNINESLVKEEQIIEDKQKCLESVDEIEKYELVDANGIKTGSIQFKKSTKGANVINLRVVVNSEENDMILEKFKAFLKTL